LTVTISFDHEVDIVSNGGRYGIIVKRVTI